MNTDPFLSKNMAGEPVVVYFIPLHLPGHYAVRLRPATEADLPKQETDEDPLFE
jgi:hypothetical protein